MRRTAEPGNNKFRPGDYYHECPVCGFNYLRSEMLVRWDGEIVCKPDWEPRHPYDKPLKKLNERPFKLQ